MQKIIDEIVIEPKKISDAKPKSSKSSIEIEKENQAPISLILCL